ncbi:hypothetical protein OH768_11640 [Streptomyces sp. NBC_01622]|uniref:hypothetical protein n=1 Tax=Streptomyces sp. NBC_01622 TaxID=2975903 RepID=UPI00386CB22B|nr:hypothetical protein OH768_11640 [Streptomyces sp. NBC_01622]
MDVLVEVAANMAEDAAVGVGAHHPVAVALDRDTADVPFERLGPEEETPSASGRGRLASAAGVGVCRNGQKRGNPDSWHVHVAVVTVGAKGGRIAAN